MSMSERPTGERHPNGWRAFKEVARREIKKIDTTLQNLFADRLKQVSIIHRAKMHLGEPVVDEERRGEVITSWEKALVERGFREGAGTIIANAILTVFEGEQFHARNNIVHPAPQTPRRRRLFRSK